MSKKFFHSLILTLLLVIPTLAQADGMIIPPPNYYMYETDQKAVIFYQNSVEDLILSVQFKGSAKNFAWIIPTPSRPEVTKSTDELFTALDELTTPEYAYESPVPLAMGDASGIQRSKGVTIIETKQVDYYDVTVLVASSPDSLYKWLNNRGYTFPSQYRYILSDYINNDWYFTAVKVNSEFLTNNLNEALRTGHAIPLRLTFTTQKIVYPLKISSIDITYQGGYYPIIYDSAINSNVNYNPNATVYRMQYEKQVSFPAPPSKVNILLYVFTDNRQTLPGFETQYAGWIKRDEILNLALDDRGQPWINPVKSQYYLTRLYRSMTKSEMSQDLYFRSAETNQTVNAPQEVERSKFGLYILFPIAGFITLILAAILIWIATSKE